MNPDAPGEADRLVAMTELRHRRVPRAIARKVFELADGGLSNFEIAAHCGLPIQMVNLILRGAAPGA